MHFFYQGHGSIWQLVFWLLTPIQWQGWKSQSRPGISLSHYEDYQSFCHPVNLPESMRIHPTSHVSQLNPVFTSSLSPSSYPPPPPHPTPRSSMIILPYGAVISGHSTLGPPIPCWLYLAGAWAWGVLLGAPFHHENSDWPSGSSGASCWGEWGTIRRSS